MADVGDLVALLDRNYCTGEAPTWRTLAVVNVSVDCINFWFFKTPSCLFVAIACPVLLPSKVFRFLLFELFKSQLLFTLSKHLLLLQPVFSLRVSEIEWWTSERYSPMIFAYHVRIHIPTIWRSGIYTGHSIYALQALQSSSLRIMAVTLGLYWYLLMTFSLLLIIVCFALSWAWPLRCRGKMRIQPWGVSLCINIALGSTTLLSNHACGCTQIIQISPSFCGCSFLFLVLSIPFAMRTLPVNASLSTYIHWFNTRSGLIWD